MAIDTHFLEEIAESHGIQEDSILYQYLERKTRASDRDSKARRSLGNLYALYVLCKDYVEGNFLGSSFSELMMKMKEMPFGSKLQNHPLDNRLNDEIRRQYAATDDLLPVQQADLGDGRTGRKISTILLTQGNMDPTLAAAFVVDAVESYIAIIDNNQTAYLNEIQAANTDAEIAKVISAAFEYNSDARLFEIISFAILHLHFISSVTTFSLNGKEFSENLTLYRTGRTNANDGGIDFVLRPLGKFYQVTETLDFRKYFLDFEKINRCPMSFVIKTNLTVAQVIAQITRDASNAYTIEQVKVYMGLFDEIYTLNELKQILEQIRQSSQLVNELKEIVVRSFKLEYGLLD